MKTGMALNPEDDFVEELEHIPREFDFVEIAVGEMEKNPGDIDTAEWKQELEVNGLELIIHLPFRQPLVSTVEEFNQAEVEYMGRMLDLAEELGAKKAVLHANMRYGQEQEEVIEEAKTQLEMINSIAEDRGIELCVENIPFEESKLGDLMEFGELVQETGASICLDTGHAFAEAEEQEELEHFAEEFSGDISHLHVQDSRGEDDHLAVGHGQIDFESLVDALGDFPGTATFEIFSPDYDYHSLSREKFLRHF